MFSYHCMKYLIVHLKARLKEQLVSVNVALQRKIKDKKNIDFVWITVVKESKNSFIRQVELNITTTWLILRKNQALTSNKVQITQEPKPANFNYIKKSLMIM